MTELVEMATLTVLTREKKISSFVSTWKSFLDFVLEVGKKPRVLFFGFAD